MKRTETGLRELLRRRRSVRSFDAARPVPGTAVRKIVEAGLAVPSPSGSLPVMIYQLESSAARGKLKREVTLAKDALLRTADAKKRNKINYYWRYTGYLFSAPLILAVTHRPRPGLLESRGEDAARLTAGLSLFSMSLMAEDLGFSSTILTAPQAFCPDIGLKLGIGEHETLCSFMAVGKKKEGEAVVERERREPRAHFLKL